MKECDYTVYIYTSMPRANLGLVTPRYNQTIINKTLDIIIVKTLKVYPFRWIGKVCIRLEYTGKSIVAVSAVVSASIPT